MAACGSIVWIIVWRTDASARTPSRNVAADPSRIQADSKLTISGDGVSEVARTAAASRPASVRFGALTKATRSPGVRHLATVLT